MPTDSHKAAFLELRKRFGNQWQNLSSFLIWTTCLVLLTGLTFREFFPLLYDFQHNNVATLISVNNTQPMKPPNMTVCIPYYSGALAKIGNSIYNNLKSNNMVYNTSSDTDCEECDALKDHIWDVWNDVGFKYLANKTNPELEIINAIGVAIVKKLLNESPKFEALKLNQSNFNWNQPIVDAMWKFFATVFVNDLVNLRSIASYEIEDIFDFDSINFPALGWISNEDIDLSFEMIFEAVKIYFESGASFSEIKLERVEVPINGKTNMNYGTGLSIQGNHFCFPLLANSNAEGFIYSPPSNDESAKPPWKRFARIRPFDVYEDSSKLYSSVSNSEALYTTNRLGITKINYEQIILMYTMEFKVVETRPGKFCSQEIAPAVCVAKRQLKLAIKYCKCVPFTFRYLQENLEELPYCNDTVYRTCWKKLTEQLEANTKECNEKCEYSFYKWNPIISAGSYENSLYQYLVALKAVNAPLLEFTLSIKDSPEKFVANIGGLLNFYLGFSGLSICAFLIFCVNLIKEWRSKKLEQNVNNNLSLQTTPNDERLFQNRNSSQAKACGVVEKANANHTCQGVSNLQDQFTKMQQEMHRQFGIFEEQQKKIEKMCQKIDTLLLGDSKNVPRSKAISKF